MRERARSRASQTGRAHLESGILDALSRDLLMHRTCLNPSVWVTSSIAVATSSTGLLLPISDAGNADGLLFFRGLLISGLVSSKFWACLVFCAEGSGPTWEHIVSPRSHDRFQCAGSQQRGEPLEFPSTIRCEMAGPLYG